MNIDVGGGLLQGQGQAPETLRQGCRLDGLLRGRQPLFRSGEEESDRFLGGQLTQGKLGHPSAPIAQAGSDQHPSSGELGEQLGDGPGRLLIVYVVQDHQPSGMVSQPGEHRLGGGRLLFDSLQAHLGPQLRQASSQQLRALGANEEHRRVELLPIPGMLHCQSRLTHSAEAVHRLGALLNDREGTATAPRCEPSGQGFQLRLSSLEEVSQGEEGQVDGDGASGMRQEILVPDGVDLGMGLDAAAKLLPTVDGDSKAHLVSELPGQGIEVSAVFGGGGDDQAL